MRVYKTRWVGWFTRRAKIGDDGLIEAVDTDQIAKMIEDDALQEVRDGRENT